MRLVLLYDNEAWPSSFARVKAVGGLTRLPKVHPLLMDFSRIQKLLTSMESQSFSTDADSQRGALAQVFVEGKRTRQ